MNASLRRFTRAALVVCAVGAASAAPAAAASAATISVDKACYVNSDPASGAPMTVSGTGFAPGETVNLSGDQIKVGATADGSGNFIATTPAPVLSTTGPGVKTTTLTATGVSSQTSASTIVRSTNLAIKLRPKRVHNVLRDKATFNFSGFTPGQHIYGFYSRGGTTVRTRFGVASGPCGTLTQRALLYPGGRPRHSVYTVTFESQPRLSATAVPKITGVLQLLAA